MSRRAGGAGPRAKVAGGGAPRLDDTLPEGYGDTRIVLLPVDPYLVHVYWEVSGTDLGHVKAPVEEELLHPRAILRFHDVTALPIGSVRAAGSFDVEISIESRNWYVRLLSPERSYVVDLGFREKDGRFRRIARSNRAETPRSRPCAEACGHRMRVAQVDGVFEVDPLVDPLGDARVVHDSGTVREPSGAGPRVEMPQEGRRAVVGLASAPGVAVEADRTREARPVHRRTEAPEEQGLRPARTEGGDEMTERIRAIGAQDKRPSPLPNPSPVDKSEEVRVNMEAVYERRPGFPPGEGEAGGERSPKGEPGPDGSDLSLLCEALFISGLSSGRVAADEEREDHDAH